MEQANENTPQKKPYSQATIKIALAQDPEYMATKPRKFVKWNHRCWHWLPGLATFHDPLGERLSGEWMFTWLGLHVYALRDLEYLRGVKNVF